MYRPGPYDTGYPGAEAGPSRPRPSQPREPPVQPPKPKKRRRLQFTSQLRNQIERYNPDGTETVEYLHQQSTQRLKRKWDSIFERFKDAHLQDQDEIYLGNRANGEPIIVVKDRGSLRSLRQSMEFGVFIKDEELQGWKDRPEARELEEQEDEYDDDIDPTHGPLRAHDGRQHLAGISSSESEDEEDDPAANDPDLREFLQAEARRKALLGDKGEGDVDEDDDVIDFGDPVWSSSVTGQDAIMTRPRPPPPPPSLRRQILPQGQDRASPSSMLSSSEDEDDTDVVTVYSDSDEELVDSIRTKRQNIEELLQCTTPFETLPYNDIFGLADLLKISDNTSRLYVDLISDDDEEEDEAAEVANDDTMAQIPPEVPIEVEAMAEDSAVEVPSSHPSSSVIADPASSQRSEPVGSQGISAMPPPSIEPSPAGPQPCSPERTASQSAVKLEPEPSQERAPLVAFSSLSQDQEPPQAVARETRSSSPAEPIETLALLSTSPVRPQISPAPEAIQTPTPEPAVRSEEKQATPRASNPPLVDSAATSATPQPLSNSPTLPKTPARETSKPPQTTSAERVSQAEASRRSVTSTKPLRTSPSTSSTRTSEPASSFASLLNRSSSTSSLHRPSSHKKKHKRRSLINFDFDSNTEARSEKKKKRPKCGGPGRCKKTFCLDCASLSLSHA